MKTSRAGRAPRGANPTGRGPAEAKSGNKDFVPELVRVARELRHLVERGVAYVERTRSIGSARTTVRLECTPGDRAELSFLYDECAIGGLECDLVCALELLADARDLIAAHVDLPVRVEIVARHV